MPVMDSGDQAAAMAAHCITAFSPIIVFWLFFFYRHPQLTILAIIAAFIFALFVSFGAIFLRIPGAYFAAGGAILVIVRIVFQELGRFAFWAMWIRVERSFHHNLNGRTLFSGRIGGAHAVGAACGLGFAVMDLLMRYTLSLSLANVFYPAIFYVDGLQCYSYFFDLPAWSSLFTSITHVTLGVLLLPVYTTVWKNSAAALRPSSPGGLENCLRIVFAVVLRISHSLFTHLAVYHCNWLVGLGLLLAVIAGWTVAFFAGKAYRFTTPPLFVEPPRCRADMDLLGLAATETVVRSQSAAGDSYGTAPAAE